MARNNNSESDCYFIFDSPKKTGAKRIAADGIRAVQALRYRCISGMIRADQGDKKYNVSVCGIFKNEAPYLREWIEFNHLVGVEHFYMYNNNSDDGFLSVLKPYMDSGLVTLVDWPHNQKQMECYMDCIEKYAQETKWLGFLDIDEFIVPKSTDLIYDFLKPFEKNRGSVKVYWRLYGSSGRMERDLSGLVTEDFTVCWPKYCEIGKCFYNTAFGFDSSSKHSKQLHHHFWANWKGKDLPPVNIFDEFCIGRRNVAKSADFPIQINHYFTKSFKEYADKRAKGDVFFKINPHDEAYFYEHEMKCTGVDYSAWKYLVKLKLALKEADE